MQSFSPPVVNGWWPTAYVDGNRAWIAVGAGPCEVIQLSRADDGTWHTTGSRTLETSGSSAGQFIRPGILSVWRERPDVGKDFSERFEYDCLADHYRLVDPPTYGFGGNMMPAADGAWGSLIAGIQVVVNGHVQASRPFVGACLSVGGNVMAFGSNTDDSAMSYAKIDGLHVGSRVPTVPLHQIVCGADERIVYGAYGPIIGFIPGADEIDLTVTPWRVETLYGGGAPHPAHGVWTGSDGRVWLATMAYRNNTGMILLREWGEKECVIIPRNAVHCSVVEAGADWLVASCSDRGALVIDIVPRNTERRRVTETVTIPSYTAADRAIMDLTFDDADCPLRLTWYAPKPEEGEPDRRDPDPGAPNVVGVYHAITIADNGRDVEHRDNIDGALAMCREHGLPLYMQCDDSCEWPHNIPSYEGVVVVPMLQIYPVGVEHRPNEPLYPLPGLKVIASNTLNRLTRTHDVAVIPAYYRQIDGDGRYSWPLEMVLDLHAWAWEQCRDNRRVLAVAPFSRRRGPSDGYENIPELAESHRKLRQVLWLHPQAPIFPSTTPPPQPPAEPPQEPQEPSQPPRPPSEPQEPPPPPQEAPRDRLVPGAILGPDEFKDSPNGLWRLYVQDDGNVVLLRMMSDGRSEAAWASNTGGNRGLYLVMQYEGNLVGYTRAGTQLVAQWATAIHAPNSHVRLTDDGDVRLEAPDGSWQSILNPQVREPRPEAPEPQSAGHELLKDHALIPGMKLVSPSGQWELLVEPRAPLQGVLLCVWDARHGSLDWIAPVFAARGGVGALGIVGGNVELWDGHTNVLWTTRDFSHGRVERLVMQDDGNLVAYAADGTAVWAKNADPRR